MSTKSSAGALPGSKAMPSLLVVDDQPINIQALYRVFSADHEVFMATSGAQALAFCAKQRPDLILLDVLMPDIDGHEVCRRLKADALTADIPVIFVTAQSDPEQETKGLQLGAVDFISKPIHAAVVRARVRAHLQLQGAMAQVRELNSGLEQRVAERTAELEAALERLHRSQESLAQSEAKATISMLVASVSHELGTPLGNSMMANSTLRERVGEFAQLIGSGALKKSDLNAFLAALGQGTDLVQQNLERANALLKNFRQVAADQASEQRREFDLGQAVQEIVHTLSPSLKRHPQRVALDIPPGILMDSQPGPLGQIVINLVNNAFLHGFENRSHGLLTISAHASGGQVELVFEDDGAGIAADHLDKLFQPFFSTKIGKGGTGLGMAIVNNLVTKTLGGSIAVRSTLGQGTRFEIRLPLILPVTNG